MKIWPLNTEGFDKAIHIEDFGIDVVQAMVYFMYHFDYKTPEDSSSLILNTEVYQIADKYGIKSLKELAAVKFGRATNTYCGSDDFLTAITLVYTTTPSTDMGLRNSILVTTFEIYDGLRGRIEFYEALKTNPDFANDLTRFLFEKTQGIERIHCFTCKRTFQFACIESRLKCCPLCLVPCDIWAGVPDPRLGLEEAFSEVKI
ncbi:hypothetical protein FAVG1_09196 [Fusarium avenaceum]|nr:hypothetical protein FAVG1_09196 [Fusarium avenaceum]